MRDFLKQIIADPITGKDIIEVKSGGKSLLSSGDFSYDISEGVPVLLPRQQNKNSNSAVHDQFNSEFDYKLHYQKDALHFDYFKEEDSAAGKEEIRRLHQTIINRVPKNANLILDIGCGNGWLAQYFVRKGKKVISVDISDKNLIKVLKNNPDQNHVAIVADAYHLPFKKNSFDAVIASEIMEHVYDPKLFMARLGEVIKPQGKLIITTPYDEKIEYFLCVHCNKPTPKNAHLHSFSEKNIANFIPTEFTDYKTTYFSNKYIVRLRLNLLTSFLPFPLWKIKDSLINSIFKKPLRFLIEIDKK